LHYSGSNQFSKELARNSLMEKLTYVSSEQVVFVDKSEMRQGLVISGYTIHATGIIKDEKLKCVVEADVQYYSALIKPIRDKFPGVERLLRVSDQLVDDSDTSEIATGKLTRATTREKDWRQSVFHAGQMLLHLRHVALQ
jgi:hypothetical protein